LRQGVDVWKKWREKNPHAIIDPAIEKHNELRLIKAQEPKVISGRNYSGTAYRQVKSSNSKRKGIKHKWHPFLMET